MAPAAREVGISGGGKTTKGDVFLLHAMIGHEFMKNESSDY
jgi:hypothetical protein